MTSASPLAAPEPMTVGRLLRDGASLEDAARILGLKDALAALEALRTELKIHEPAPRPKPQKVALKPPAPKAVDRAEAEPVMDEEEVKLPPTERRFRKAWHAMQLAFAARKEAPCNYAGPIAMKGAPA